VPARADEQLVESDDRGLMIATPAGEIQYFSPLACRLIVLAMHPELSFAAMARAGPGPLLPPEVARLCQDLVRIFEDKAPSGAPVCQLTNPLGRLHLPRLLARPRRGARRFGADRDHGRASRAACPKAVARAEELPLTGRELEVCQLLALGRSRAEIAERLGVRENTAIDHCRNLYGKLGVHSRAELIQSLNARL